MKFGESAGGAIKNNLDYMKFNEGVNTMRIVGDIIPRYAYWKQLKDYNIPVECLAFDRKEERFTNVEKDWFKHYFPKRPDGKDMYPVWSYVGRVIDPKDGKLKMVGFKKKLFEQIQTLAKKDGFGDPTDTKTGWPIVFNKNKTGVHAFNVEYVLDQLECKPIPLTAAELELIKDMPAIETLVVRPTADEQKAFIENNWINPQPEENVDKEAADSIGDDFDDDIPF